MKKEPLNKQDWINAQKSLSFWKDDWGIKILGGLNGCDFPLFPSEQECRKNGWPSVQITLGRGLYDEIEKRANDRQTFSAAGLNFFQDEINDAWESYIITKKDKGRNECYYMQNNYFDLLSNQEGRSVLKTFFVHMENNS